MASKFNLIVIFLITIYMGCVFIFSTRSASEIFIIAVGMALLNSGVPISIIFDKLISLRQVNK